MKRLVYSPKAFVFVKDQNNQIHNISQYVTGGNIVRKIDQVSTASITLRNPEMIFTSHLDEDGLASRPLFHPMDPITIYLRRVKDRPVRVFTGFLDKSPYLQLFPGTVSLEASCTIKRIQHTYFDPALIYTRDFLTTYGWIMTPEGYMSENAMGGFTQGGLGSDSTNVYIVGDSLTNGSKKAMPKSLKNYNIETDAVDGRTTEQGVDALAQKGSKLPKTVVVALGTNDSPTDTSGFRARVRRALRIVGNDRHLIWVNISRPPVSGNSYDALNNILKDEASKHSNMSVVDWESVVKEKDVNLDGQNVHTDANGYEIRAEAISDVVRSGAKGGDQKSKNNAQDVDGSLGELLFKTMEKIGNWNPNDLYIEQLPVNLFERLTAMSAEFIQDSEEAKEEFLDLMKRIAGSSSHGSPDGVGDEISGATGDIKGIDKIVSTMARIASDNGIPPAFVVAVGLVETELAGATANAKYRGWFQMQSAAPPYAYGRFSKRIPTNEETLDLGIATTGYCEAALGWLKKEPGLKNNWQSWAIKVQGITNNLAGNPRFSDPAQWDGFVKRAKRLVSQYADTPSNSNKDSEEPDETVRSETKGGTNKTTNSSGSRLTSPIKGLSPDGWPGSGGAYGASRDYGGHAGIDIPSPLGEPWYAITGGEIVSINEGWADNGQPAVIMRSDEKFAGHADPLYFGYGSFQSIDSKIKVGTKVDAGQILGLGGTHGGGPHLHFFLANSASATNGTEDPTSFVKAAVRGEQPPDGQNSNSDTPADTSGTAGGDESIFGGTLFGAIELPSLLDSAEAELLVGQRSLMNDQSLLPFVQQLCNAGLRQFQSLPDGRFYAFYPDYFGELNQHPPYWEIDDIEILDGKIDLNDDALVTHMFVVGDTVNPVGNSTPFSTRALNSAGIVTIFNTFMSDSILNRTQSREDNRNKADKGAADAKKEDWLKEEPAGMDLTMDRNEAALFLDRYGARPLVENMPMIKSQYYEMFLAYQHFLLSWSKQFSTQFTFTFMPELFPGGKVGFPDHGLQMYIEEVTHEFSYEDGFVTMATLSAPNVYGVGSPLLPPNMVRAIVEPVKEKAVNPVKRTSDVDPVGGGIKGVPGKIKW